MNGARPRIGNRPVFNRKIVLASSEARESHVSRDSRQVFDSRVEHLTRRDLGMKEASSSSRLAFTVSHLAWAGLWLIGKRLALPVERLLRGNRADRACFRPYRIRTQAGARYGRSFRGAGRPSRLPRHNGSTGVGHTRASRRGFLICSAAARACEIGTRKTFPGASEGNASVCQ